MTTDILWFSELGLKDLDRVGGKNASLGEMVQNLTSAGVQVPDGFATTADAYRNFLADSGLDQKIADRLVGLDTDDVTALAAAGQEIRKVALASGAVQRVCALPRQGQNGGTWNQHGTIVFSAGADKIGIVYTDWDTDAPKDIMDAIQGVMKSIKVVAKK